MCPAREGLSNKINPVIDTLNHTFLQYYNPAQELSVDEAMVSTKVTWEAKFACRGNLSSLALRFCAVNIPAVDILCTFQVYHGASRDLVTGRKAPERGLAKRVVGNLVSPFEVVNHVIYCDNFF